MKIRPWEPSCSMRTDGQAGRQTRQTGRQAGRQTDKHDMTCHDIRKLTVIFAVLVGCYDENTQQTQYYLLQHVRMQGRDRTCIEITFPFEE
jgi:hypothetical protein